jgi:hypothetical protein
MASRMGYSDFSTGIISMRFDKALLSVAEGFSASGSKNQIFAFVVSVSNYERKYLMCACLKIETL